MQTYFASPDTTLLASVPDESVGAWRVPNDQGVTLALAGFWPDALEQFTSALHAAPCFADAPDVHALLHGNRAQAHFHCGELWCAVESARRSLAARQICSEEEGAPVARIRADLAVYLAACGALDEANEQLSRARGAIEARFGDDDARLVTILENQKRFAVLAGERIGATLPRTQLRTLQTEHDVTPDSSEVLDPTDDLYGPIVDAVPPQSGVNTCAAASATEDAHDEFELVDTGDYPAMRSPSTAAILHAGLIEPGTHSTPPHAPKRTHPLGFEIQYGVPQELLNGDTD